MKKLILLVPLLLSGCGIEMVRKQNLLDGLDKAKSNVDAVRNESCSQIVTDRIDATYALLEALINEYK